MGDLGVYGGLFLSAFVAETLLPTASEAVLVGLYLTGDHARVAAGGSHGGQRAGLGGELGTVLRHRAPPGQLLVSAEARRVGPRTGLAPAPQQVKGAAGPDDSGG